MYYACCVVRVREDEGISERRRVVVAGRQVGLDLVPVLFSFISISDILKCSRENIPFSSSSTYSYLKYILFKFLTTFSPLCRRRTRRERLRNRPTRRDSLPMTSSVDSAWPARSDSESTFRINRRSLCKQDVAG